MSRASDLIGILRGLEKVAQAVAAQQQKELATRWSSARMMEGMQDLGTRMEEKVSDALVNQPAVKDPYEGRVSSLTLAVESISKQVSFVMKILQESGAGPPSAYPASQQEQNFDQIFERGDSFIPEQNLFKSAVTDSDFFEIKTAPRTAETTRKEPALPSDNIRTKTDSKTPTQTLARDASKLSHATTQNRTIYSTVDTTTIEDLAQQAEEKIRKRKTEFRIPQPKGISRALGAKPVGKGFTQQLGQESKERKVPGSRLGRLMSFGGLAASLGMGAITEATKRSLGISSGKGKKDGALALLDQNPFLTEANAEKIVNTLCRVRGAALKLGQTLSIQDSTTFNPQLQKIFERVRQSADFMPAWQMERVLEQQLGSDWRGKLKSFDSKPFAAASIGQVHRGVLPDGRQVAMKIQYPGVSRSIESDVNNLMSVLKVWKILPDGLYAENALTVAKRELGWECDYIREANCANKFKELLKDDPVFYVPEVIMDLSTKQVLTSELVNGVSLDKLVDADQETRDFVAHQILRLCLSEVFQYSFMQTDPNWSNFLYDADTGRISLLDFGASRQYSREFVDGYIKVIYNASIGNREGVLQASRNLNFLTGHENKVMEEAHINAVMILGEAFSHDEPFDFSIQSTSVRVNELIPVMLKHRLKPPPEETYSLHRKMAGGFLLCTKLRAKVNCKPMFDEIWETYEFGKQDEEIVV